MPLQLIISEGILNPEGEAKVFSQLTDLLLELNGISGHTFMKPNVIGEVSTLPKGRTYSGGMPTEIAIFELKVPSFVLANREAQLEWISRGTDIILQAANGKLKRDKIAGNVVYAVDGLWGIDGHAYTNEELGSVLAGERAPF
ncbi:MAG: Tautomerase enzyme [Hyphomicrobiales bacterium]